MQVFPGLGHGGAGRAQLGVGVQHGKVQLVFDRVQVDEEVVHFVEDLLRARVGTIDLVDDQDGQQLGLQRLREHVTGLRQGAFRGIDQKHDAVHHLEGALDLATKVGVARRIDNVDLGVVELDGRVLGQNGDAALASPARSNP